MYKVKNKLNRFVKCNDVLFAPNETLELKEKPYSDKFEIEKNEKPEKKITTRRSE